MNRLLGFFWSPSHGGKDSMNGICPFVRLSGCCLGIDVLDFSETLHSVNGAVRVCARDSQTLLLFLLFISCILSGFLSLFHILLLVCFSSQLFSGNTRGPLFLPELLTRLQMITLANLSSHFGPNEHSSASSYSFFLEHFFSFFNLLSKFILNIVDFQKLW